MFALGQESINLYFLYLIASFSASDVFEQLTAVGTSVRNSRIKIQVLGNTWERETEVCYSVNSYYAEYSRGLLHGRLGRQYKYDNMQKHFIRRYLKDSSEMMYLKILEIIKFYKIYSTVLLNKSGIFYLNNF